MPTPARLFFWTTCLAAVCAGVAGLTRLPWDFEPGASHPAWLHRYESLSASLAGASAATFVSDDHGGTAKYKLFRAQFALAPVVLLDRRRFEAVNIHQLLHRPLILDTSSPRLLDEAVADLSRRAREAGLSLAVERLPRGLAVLRAQPTQ